MVGQIATPKIVEGSRVLLLNKKTGKFTIKATCRGVIGGSGQYLVDLDKAGQCAPAVYAQPNEIKRA